MLGPRLEGREGLSGRWMRLQPVSYAVFSGMLGTQSVVFCKSLSSLLRTTFAGDSQLGSLFFWLLMAAFVATAAFWVNRLNQASRQLAAFCKSWSRCAPMQLGLQMKGARQQLLDGYARVHACSKQLPSELLSAVRMLAGA